MRTVNAVKLQRSEYTQGLITGMGLIALWVVFFMRGNKNKNDRHVLRAQTGQRVQIPAMKFRLCL